MRNILEDGEHLKEIITEIRKVKHLHFPKDKSILKCYVETDDLSFFYRTKHLIEKMCKIELIFTNKELEK